MSARQLVAQRELVAVQHELRTAHDDLAVAYEAEQLAAARRERMEIELRLAQKLEAVGQLAAGIAHEINTPIQFVGDTSRFLRAAFDDLMPLVDRYADVVNAARQGPVPAELFDRVAAAEELADVEYLRERVPAAFERTSTGIGHIAEIVSAMRTFAHPATGKAPVDINQSIRNTRDRHGQRVQVRRRPGHRPGRPAAGDLQRQRSQPGADQPRRQRRPCGRGRGRRRPADAAGSRSARGRTPTA